MPDGLQSLRLAPQRDIAQRFVELLTGSPDPVIRLRFIRDSDKGMPTEELEGTLGELWETVVDLQGRGYGVFYFMNEVRPGHGGYAKDADMVSIRTLATDHDEGIPDDWEWRLHPKIIVHTSTVTGDGEAPSEVRKGQALWPVIGCSVDAFRLAQQRLAAWYGSDTQVCNPSRILRLPGTLHLKNPAVPQLVTFEDCSDRWRGPFTLANILAGLPEPKTTPGSFAPSSATGKPVTTVRLCHKGNRRRSDIPSGACPAIKIGLLWPRRETAGSGLGGGRTTRLRNGGCAAATGCQAGGRRGAVHPRGHVCGRHGRF
jgi:hypothetical protein